MCWWNGWIIRSMSICACVGRLFRQKSFAARLLCSYLGVIGGNGNVFLLPAFVGRRKSSCRSRMVATLIAHCFLCRLLGWIVQCPIHCYGWIVPFAISIHLGHNQFIDQSYRYFHGGSFLPGHASLVGQRCDFFPIYCVHSGQYWFRLFPSTRDQREDNGRNGKTFYG